jgi:uncharacterized membrane protein
MEEKKRSREGWGKKLGDYFVAGILVIVPLGASILILIWVFNSIDHILQPIIRAIAGHDITGVGFGVTIILIFVVGIVARNFIGKKLVKYGESLITRVPVFRSLYYGIRQILESMASSDKTGFMRVVLVEFPRKDMWTIAFVTNETVLDNGEKLLNLLVPTSPTPWSGFFQIVKETDVIPTKITVEEALKMSVSGGMTVPRNFKDIINYTKPKA